MREYYDQRAPEYDDWYLGTGLHAGRERPGWEAELDHLRALIGSLPAKSTLDVACGSGFLTRHLPPPVVGLDQSPGMLQVARRQAPKAEFVQGDALALPFEDGHFERVFTAHFYGHLGESDRAAFLAEARRVGRELVIVDAARNVVSPADGPQARVLKDGSEWEVLKRYFTAAALAAEIGGGEVLHDGDWFVAVSATI